MRPEYITATRSESGHHAHVVGHQHHGSAVVAAEPLISAMIRPARDVERGGRLVAMINPARRRSPAQ
jgi:hypothetical protein